MMNILDIAVGLVFTYVLLALMCTTLQEMIAAALRSRARHLANGISNLLLDPERTHLARTFFAHPLIRTLAPEGKFPSYIAAATFAHAIVDIAKRNGNLAAGNLNPVFAPLWMSAGGDVDRFRKELETWFDEGMDRVSGWYTRRSQLVSTLLAIGLAVALNADSLSIARALRTDAVLRTALVKQADVFVGVNANGVGTLPCQDKAGDDATKCLTDQLKAYQKQLDDSNLPIGWKIERLTGPPATGGPGHDCTNLVGYKVCTNDGGAPMSPGRIAGWMLTALAVSLGAKFWFDLLQKLIQLRASGGKPPPPQPVIRPA